MKLLAFLWMILIVLVPEVQAVEPSEVLKDPILESRARSLSAEIRCLVCQNQSIDDSNADLARDLRLLVRERLLEGDSNQEVLDYLSDRYGDFVLLTPPVKPKTLILWFGPLGMLVLALIMVAFYFLRRRPALVEISSNEMSSEEVKRLEDLLKENNEKTT